MIGREREQQQLGRMYSSEESEFVAVYGRRRVGKTTLVREYFGSRLCFQHTGLAKGVLRDQLQEFRRSLMSAGAGRCKVFHSWYDAFSQLGEFLEKLPRERKVVFLDELPWMDTVRSNFVSALEHFWNGWASARRDILLIVCGSAASWMISHVIKDHGGLHNRVTMNLFLEPFTLRECEMYAYSRGLSMSRRDIVEAYMILGGVPYYWKFLEKSRSLAQNIDEMFFSRNGALRYEFRQLYESLYRHPAGHLKVVSALGIRKAGMTREELSRSIGVPLNGELTSVLEELEQCGFIQRYMFFGQKRKETLYQLMDNFTLFYFKFLKDAPADSDEYWQTHVNAPGVNAWRGLAFERVCLRHVPQIKAALGVLGVSTHVQSWFQRGEGERAGGQIDLLIDRADNVINICEMKFTREPFEISADYMEQLEGRMESFRESTGTRKALHLTFVTSCGIVHNAQWNRIQAEILLEDLFRE